MADVGGGGFQIVDIRRQSQCPRKVSSIAATDPSRLTPDCAFFY